MHVPPPVRSCVPAEVMQEYLADRLGEPQAQPVTEHVADCPRCQDLMRSLAQDPELRAWIRECGPLSSGTGGDPGLTDLLQKLRDVTRHTPHPQETPPPFLAPPKHADELGRLGEYEVLQVLGEGGMGVVLKARDPKLERTVALKVIRPDQVDETSRARFVREIRAMAGLRHDNVVTVFSVETPPDAPPFLVMEYVPGPTLQQRIRAEKQLDPREVATIGLQVASGLGAAHAAGHVHRDIKPSNIILDPATGRAKILDFGLVRSAEGPSQLTQHGSFLGTPGYMSPEQHLAPERVGPRSDLYSLGITLYEALTGEVPFRNQLEKGLGGMTEQDRLFPGPLRERVAAELRRICKKCLQREPEQRYASAAAVAEDLRQFLAGESKQAQASPRWRSEWRWKPRRQWAAAIVGLCSMGLVALAVFAFWPESEFRILALEVEAFRGEPAQPLGIIGQRCETTQFDDMVRVSARLSRPAYCYLIAFNPDGQDQLCYPNDANTPPTRLMRLNYPLDPENGFRLNDGTGLQAFVLIVTRQRLPSFAQWQSTFGTLPWQQIHAAGVWSSDGEGQLQAHGIERGTIEHMVRARPLLAPFEHVCQSLKNRPGIETIQAWAFPVKGPATEFDNQAAILEAQGRLSEAEPWWQKALAENRQKLGDEHRVTATSYARLAGNLHAQKRLKENSSRP
jgi:tRNA A-37 threonylcarbamoyl transferase component Bud32